MNKIRVATPLILLVLTACGGGGGGLCSGAAEGSLAPTCSPPRPAPSPVGSWQGTFVTTTGGSGTQVFTAEITKSASEAARGFTGVFTVGSEIYKVTGGNRYIDGESEIFTFSVPIDDLQPTLSPVEFYGMVWKGPMIENTYSGDWYFNSETEYRSPAGEFVLERLP